MGDKVGDKSLNISQIKVLAEIRNNPNITKPELMIKCSLSKTSILQFDSVHGKRSDKKCILTIHHPYSKFQIGILLENLTSAEVLKKIRDIEYKVRQSDFYKYFRILLCDNGLTYEEFVEMKK